MSEIKSDQVKNQENNQAETPSEQVKNLNANIDRHKAQVREYAKFGFLDNIPDFYKAEYQQLVAKHLAELNKQPIKPGCKFTLVLPAYREERVIKQTLESLQKQTGISQDDFEVIVVVNYEQGKKPKVNDYAADGKIMGQHEDQTKELVEEFSRQSDLNVMVVEQDFPAEVKGVGIACKLGMDLAISRQQDNPQIVGYYGADTIFDAQWVKGVLDGFKQENTDGVRGVAKTGLLSNRVEDENGLHILSQEQMDAIMGLEEARFKYSMKLKELEGEIKISQGETKQQLHGLPAVSAGMYAKIGGMKAFNDKGVKVTIGEDMKIAQDVADNGSIFWNSQMRTQTLPRIEKPRAGGGSYTESLWSMFRAYQYGEGELLDASKNLMVANPEANLIMNKYTDLLKKMYVGLGDQETEAKLSELLDQQEIVQIKESMKKHPDNWQVFLDNVPQELKMKIRTKLDNMFPKMPLAEAEKKLADLKRK